MKLVHGNILEILPPGGILFHQVNTLGKFNAGLAGQIRRKWPEIAEDYESAMKSAFEPKLGSVRISAVGNNPLAGKLVCHLFAQDTIGRSGKHTNYTALARALSDAAILLSKKKEKYFFPYKMGCGLGGGDWLFVEQLIEENFPDATIVKLP